MRAPVSLRDPQSIVWLVLFEVADFPMMRKCLLGIKRRAEKTAGSRQLRPISNP